MEIETILICLVIYFIIKFCDILFKKLFYNLIKKNFSKEKSKNIPKNIIDNSIIHNWAIDKKNNVVTRGLQESCIKLDLFDNITELNNESFKLSGNNYCKCYGCSRIVQELHPIYVHSCIECGNFFQKNRYLTSDLSGKIAFVTGARTKLGHQIVVKLLRAGAKVYGTTRYPNKAIEMYTKYSDYDEFKDRLVLLELDIDSNDIVSKINQFKDSFDKLDKLDKLDILINCAAQTIRNRDKNIGEGSKEMNRYGDSKFLDNKYINSWGMKITDFEQNEMEELFRINAIGPALIIQQLIPLLKKSEGTPYIITIAAREGLFSVYKSNRHIHTNMAKAACHMLMLCLPNCKLKTMRDIPFSTHLVDPGWISVDEYYEDERPWIVPPLDEIDGAARILYPLFKELKSCAKTRRHFNHFSI